MGVVAQATATTMSEPAHQAIGIPLLLALETDLVQMV